MEKFLYHINGILEEQGIEGARELLVIPQEVGRGDIALPCFVLAKTKQVAPNMVAAEIAGTIKPDAVIARVEAVGPFVNFFFKDEVLAKMALENAGQVMAPEKTNHAPVMVEFFHANTHKAVHLGHLRNISLGESLCRLLEAVGEKVVRANYQGDIGPHVAKCLWALKKFGEKIPSDRKSAWLASLYVRGNTASEADENAKQEIREVNKKIYAHDASWEKLYQETRQWCLEDFQEIYKNWGVKYDRFFFESEVEEAGKKLAEQLLERGVLEKSQGAIIANLELEGLPVIVVITGDGTPLYAAKDLALAELKHKEYPELARSLHLVGHEQELYFKQLLAIFKRGKFALAEISEHAVYALVRLPEGKMSSRSGNVVTYFDIMDKLVALATEEATKRHAEWSEELVAKTSLVVALAGLKFSLLKSEPNKEIVFDEKAALQFEGDTGPYLLYSYARCRSIQRRAGPAASAPQLRRLALWLRLLIGVPAPASPASFKEPAERALLRHLLQFSDKVNAAAAERRPSTLAAYLLETAQLFNTFYHQHKVLEAPPEIRTARLQLVYAVAKTLHEGLRLLGIETVEEI